MQTENRIWRTTTPKFPRSSIHNILRDRAYIGEIEHKGEWYPGTQEPLIDRATWDRVQTLRGNQNYATHLTTYGSELIRCGHCGHPITGEVKTKLTKSGPKEYVYYRCARYTKPGHPRTRIPEADFDRQILALFDKMRIEDEEVRDWFRAVLRSQTKDRQAESQAMRHELQRQQTLLAEQQDRLLNMRLAEDVDQATYARKSTEIRDRLASIKLQLDAVDRSRDEMGELASKVFELSQVLREKWLSADCDEKRRILEIVCLRDRTWHDDAGNVVKSIGSASEAFTKSFYDAVGRTIRTQMGYEAPSSSSSSSSPSSLDKIFSQTNTTYDKASNVLVTESLARYHDFTGTGDLVANTNARPTYTAYYPEYYPGGTGRESAVAQYGTNDEQPFTRSATVPGRSDIILVNSTKYNLRGEAEEQTDPRGIVAREEFDNAGRRETRIENYVSASSSSSSSTCWTDDQNVTTTWVYNASGAVETVTVHNASTGDQTTEYHYGVTVAGGSKLESNDMLHQITFPGGATHAFFEYNCQGEKITTTDQNETVHEFSYDKSGRLTVDEVTEFGDGVDGTIYKIVTEYDERGRMSTVTDYFPPDAPDPESVHSQILNVYNGLDMMVRQYQEHLGVVRPVNGSSSSSSGSAPSLYVDFNFDMTVDGSVYSKGVRPTSIVYPSGRYVHYDYGTSGGDGDKLSRIAEIKDDDNSTVLAAYDYLGAGRVVIEDYVQPQVKLDYTTSACTPSSSSSSGAASTKYPGFDRFGRVVQHQWCNYGMSPGIVDRFDYTYDRDSNPLTKQSYACPNTSELRIYDGLNRMKTYKRGALSSGSIPSPVRQEAFSLDPTANWKCYDIRISGSLTLEQTQTHNELDEITSITNSVGDPWFEPVYDANGNMIKCPQPAAMNSGFDLTFDAWNRVVQVNKTTGGAIVAAYRYDPVSRRTTVVRNAGSTYEHSYFSVASHTIEKREGISGTTIPTTYNQQYVRAAQGIVIMYDRNPASLSSSSSSLSGASTPSRFFLTADAAGVTTALFDRSGACFERYVYAAHGEVTFLSPGCSPWAIQESAYAMDSVASFIRLDPDTLFYGIAGGQVVVHPVLGVIVAEQRVKTPQEVYEEERKQWLVDALNGKVRPAPIPPAPPPPKPGSFFFGQRPCYDCHPEPELRQPDFRPSPCVDKWDRGGKLRISNAWISNFTTFSELSWERDAAMWAQYTITAMAVLQGRLACCRKDGSVHHVSVDIMGKVDIRVTHHVWTNLEQDINPLVPWRWKAMVWVTDIAVNYWDYLKLLDRVSQLDERIGASASELCQLALAAGVDKVKLRLKLASSVLISPEGRKIRGETFQRRDWYPDVPLVPPPRPFAQDLNGDPLYEPDSGYFDNENW